MGFRGSSQLWRHLKTPKASTVASEKRSSPVAVKHTIHEQPPPYAPPGITSANIAGLPAPEDSPYAFLRTFDTIFLIDDSGSMAGGSWRETSRALSAIAPICTTHDPDGIDVYFLNHRSLDMDHGGYVKITTSTTVQGLFSTVRPRGGTPTGTRLNQILKPYLSNLEKSLERHASGQAATINPLNIIVITDGVPSDDVESVIVHAARKLDRMGADAWQVGIQFFQVGRAPEATEMLTDLDDALSDQYKIRDMVDTVPWRGSDDDVGLTGDGLLKVCLGSVVRRWDRRRT